MFHKNNFHFGNNPSLVPKHANECNKIMCSVTFRSENEREKKVDLEHYHTHTQTKTHIQEVLTWHEWWGDLRDQGQAAGFGNSHQKWFNQTTNTVCTSGKRQYYPMHTLCLYERMETASEKSLEPQWTDKKEIKETHIPPKFIILSA